MWSLVGKWQSIIKLLNLQPIIKIINLQLDEPLSGRTLAFGDTNAKYLGRWFRYGDSKT